MEKAFGRTKSWRDIALVGSWEGQGGQVRVPAASTLMTEAGSTKSCYQQAPGLGRSDFKPQLSHLSPGNIKWASTFAKIQSGDNATSLADDSRVNWSSQPGRHTAANAEKWFCVLIFKTQDLGSNSDSAAR